MMTDSKKQNTAQINVLGNIYNNILKGLSLGKTLIMAQGSARCFAKGTRVRMANGKLKNIEDIEVGDRIMSADGNGYNTVTETHRGLDSMYRVHQNRGLDYVVNSNHVLSLKQTEAFTRKVRISRLDEPYKFQRVPIPYDHKTIHNFDIGQFNSKSRNFKRRFAGTKNTLLQFPHSELPIDPYYLGIWLGDGSSKAWHFISNIDVEVMEYIKEYAQSLGTNIQQVDDVSYKLVVHKGGVRNEKINEKVSLVYDAFKKYDLINNKHIPEDFIYTSYTNRLKLLAGLLDSDGYNTRRNTIAITQKNREIAEAIVELCHITGFYTNGIATKIAKMKRDDGSIYECEVYIIEINHNNFNDLNRYMRVKRKRIENKNCPRDYYSTKINISYWGVGEYFGFTLDNSPYFLLEDGTLVHNSGKSRNIMIFLCLRCLNEVKKVSVVRQSLPTIKRSILEDFKIVMQQMGQWEDRRFNKTDFVYYFPNGSIMEFFSAEDEQKLRGPSRDILYANEANEISYYAFSNLRMRTYEFCIVDYNPTFTEEHWLFPLMTDERTYYFKSTFMDNMFLPQAAREEILSYKETNPALWKIYGEGEFAIIDGLVFPKENWDIIPDEDFPTWLGEEFLGLDWGFTCFSGDTLIMTRDGNKPIKDIKAGDFVLTRCGFRKVVAALNKGVKEVTEKEFTICGKTIKFIATDNHKFYANGKWKKYEALTERDRLCVLSSLADGVTDGTQMVNTQITISTSGKKTENFTAEDCTGTFGSLSMEKSRRGRIFTTRTETLLTIILAIFNWLLIVSTQKFTTILNGIINRTQSTTRKFNTLRKIGVRVGLLLLNGCRAIQKHANGVGARLSQQMCISDFVEKSATTNGNTNRLTTLLRQYVQYVAQNLCKTSILNSSVVQKNVHISYQEISDTELLGKSEQLVYDLSVEGCHEYFANGVLVHNCDPTVCVGAIVNDTDIYVREYFREVGLKTKDIAKMLEPYKDLYKYCDIDNRLVSELEDAGIPLLTMTHKNSESIMSGIRLMNQRHIHITASSTELIKEFRNYVYKKDRQDVYQTNLRPIDKFNHGIDGLRYIVYAECSGRSNDDTRGFSKEELGIFM